MFPTTLAGALFALSIPGSFSDSGLWTRKNRCAAVAVWQLLHYVGVRADVAEIAAALGPNDDRPVAFDAVLDELRRRGVAARGKRFDLARLESADGPMIAAFRRPESWISHYVFIPMARQRRLLVVDGADGAGWISIGDAGKIWDGTAVAVDDGKQSDSTLTRLSVAAGGAILALIALFIRRRAAARTGVAALALALAGCGMPQSAFLEKASANQPEKSPLSVFPSAQQRVVGKSANGEHTGELEFELQNNGEIAVNVLGIEASCNCSSHSLESRRIEPGKKTKLRLIIRGFAHSPVRAGLKIRTDVGPPLEITGDLQASETEPRIMHPPAGAVERIYFDDDGVCQVLLTTTERSDSARWLRGVRPLSPKFHLEVSLEPKTGAEGDDQTIGDGWNYRRYLLGFRIPGNVSLVDDVVEVELLNERGECVERRGFHFLVRPPVEAIPSAVAALIEPGRREPVRRTVLLRVNHRVGDGAVAAVRLPDKIPDWAELRVVPSSEPTIYRFEVVLHPDRIGSRGEKWLCAIRIEGPVATTIQLPVEIRR